jgi:hypothetical protein
MLVVIVGSGWNLALLVLARGMESVIGNMLRIIFMMRMQDLDDTLMLEEDLEDDDPLQFQEARYGDHLLTSFQCDCHHFQNLKGRNPTEENHQDSLLLVCI